MKTLQTPVISTQKCTTRQFWWSSDKNSGLSPILALVVDIRSAPYSKRASSGALRAPGSSACRRLTRASRDNSRFARQGPTAPKGCPKNNAFFWSFFRPTSDDNISGTVYPIYLKIYVQRVPTGHSSHINFQVNPINRFRNIDIGSWPKKNYIIFGAPFIWQTEVSCRPPRMYKYVFFNCVRN